MLIAAIVLTFAVSLMHSVIGEIRLIRPLLALPNLPVILGSLENTKRTIRIAWHITSLNWWGLAAVMYYIHTGGEQTAQFFLVMVAAIFAVSGSTALILSRGAHLSWVFFLPMAGLTLYAAWMV